MSQDPGGKSSNDSHPQDDTVDGDSDQHMNYSSPNSLYLVALLIWDLLFREVKGTLKQNFAEIRQRSDA